MSAPKHTAGPWASPGWVPTWAYIPVRAPGGGLVCSVYPAGREVDYMERAEANARLIAAAPDLLEALTAARAYVAMSVFGGNLEQIDAAIAKASGADQ